MALNGRLLLPNSNRQTVNREFHANAECETVARAGTKFEPMILMCTALWPAELLL